MAPTRASHGPGHGLDYPWLGEKPSRPASSVGGIVELLYGVPPDAPSEDSSRSWPGGCPLTMAALAPAAVVALGTAAWYARGRFSPGLIHLWRRPR